MISGDGMRHIPAYGFRVRASNPWFLDLKVNIKYEFWPNTPTRDKQWLAACHVKDFSDFRHGLVSEVSENPAVFPGKTAVISCSQQVFFKRTNDQKTLFGDNSGLENIDLFGSPTFSSSFGSGRWSFSILRSHTNLGPQICRLQLLGVLRSSMWVWILEIPVKF